VVAVVAGVAGVAIVAVVAIVARLLQEPSQRVAGKDVANGLSMKTRKWYDGTYVYQYSISVGGIRSSTGEKPQG